MPEDAREPSLEPPPAGLPSEVWPAAEPAPEQRPPSDAGPIPAAVPPPMPTAVSPPMPTAVPPPMPAELPAVLPVVGPATNLAPAVVLPPRLGFTDAARIGLPPLYALAIVAALFRRSTFVLVVVVAAGAVLLAAGYYLLIRLDRRHAERVADV